MKKILYAIFNRCYFVLAKTPLRKIPGMLNLSNVFFRLFWNKGNIITVQGNKFYINVRDPHPSIRKTFQAYGMNLVHEEETTKLFKKIIRRGDVVIDLGSNIGYFTLLAAQHVGPTGKVFAFEPEPTNFFYLKKNIGINNFNNAHAFQMAASNKNGKTKLYICSYDSGHHTIEQYGGIEAYRQGRPSTKKHIEVSTVALDEFLKNKTERVDVIKMDVEGAEALAVSGMKNILHSNPDIKMLIEFFPLLMKNMGSSPGKYIQSLLEEFKFSIYAIGHDYDLSNSKEELIKIPSVSALLSLIKNESDHVNLFLTRNESNPIK